MSGTIKSWEIAIDMWPEQPSVRTGLPSGVKITHHATGIIVICNSEPSMLGNRLLALEGLNAMLNFKEDHP